MPIDYSTLVGLPVGTEVIIKGKTNFDSAHIAALNNWSHGDDGIEIIGIAKDENLKPGLQELRFKIAPFFKAGAFIRSFGARLRELTIIKYDENNIPYEDTQIDGTADLPPSIGESFKLAKNTGATA